MRASFLGLCAGLAVCASGAHGEQAFGGHEAAIVDWAYRNCDLLSTPKEHSLADDANAKGGDAFRKQYQEQSQKLSASITTPGGKADMCASVRQEYGHYGTLIAGLLREQSESVSDEPSVDTPPAKPAAGETGGHHRRGRQGQ